MDDSIPTGSVPTSVSGLAADDDRRPSVPDLASSSSGLSDAPNMPAIAGPTEAGASMESDLDAAELMNQNHAAQPVEVSSNSANSAGININVEGGASAGTPEWEAAKDQSETVMATPVQFPVSTDTSTRGGVKVRARGVGRGRGGGRPRGSRARGRGVGFAGPAPSVNGDATATPLEDGTQTPVPIKPRGRGRGGGRPRGSRARGGGRGGKRKREDGEDEDDDDDDSDSSEVTPIATMTKSGRSVQKPTSFVPPPPSPVNTNKRKRPYARRNPEAAVCKVCLRGSSPTTNMIVFCDGCNMAYHRYCHQPPIDQAVIDEVDKEWYCRHCESERVVPVPEAEVASFVSVEGATAEQRQRYFSKLAPGVLITLLTKVTTMHPDLPLFAPSFKASLDSAAAEGPSVDAAPAQAGASIPSVSTNGTVRDPYAAIMPPPPPQPSFGQSHASSSKAGPPKPPAQALEEYYGPDVHPTKYPRPGQGLMSTLPPDKDDLQWLVEDDNFGVFTHLYQPDPTITDATASGHARADASSAGRADA